MLFRSQRNRNLAYAKSGGNWKPFYEMPGLGISTSLLINAIGCDNTLAVDTIPTPPITSKYIIIYQQSGLIMYQQTGLNDHLLLQNTGKEELGTVSLYDILGRKLYEDRRVLTNTPGAVSTGQLPTGIYFLTIDAAQTRQVIKFMVNYPR